MKILIINSIKISRTQILILQIKKGVVYNFNIILKIKLKIVLELISKIILKKVLKIVLKIIMKIVI